MESEERNHLIGTRLRGLLLPENLPVCHLLRRQQPLLDERLQHRMPHGGRPPVRHFALDRKRIGEFSSSPSLSPPSFPETFVALKDALDEEEKEGRRQQTMNRQKNGANSLSLLLLKGRGAVVRKGCANREGETAGQKSLSFPSLSPPSFLETFVALRNAHGKKEERRRR